MIGTLVVYVFPSIVAVILLNMSNKYHKKKMIKDVKDVYQVSSPDRGPYEPYGSCKYLEDK